MNKTYTKRGIKLGIPPELLNLPMKPNQQKGKKIEALKKEFEKRFVDDFNRKFNRGSYFGDLWNWFQTHLLLAREEGRKEGYKEGFHAYEEKARKIIKK